MSWEKLNWINGEVWVLAEASDTMKRYVKRKYPEQYDEEIKKYETPIKLIRAGDDLISVSVTGEGWGGIRRFGPDHYLLLGSLEKGLTWRRNVREGETILSAIDFQVPDGVATTQTEQMVVTMETTRVSEQFWEEMSKTPWLTKEELEWARDRKNTESLPRIKFGPM